jgi:hypothetical protein
MQVQDVRGERKVSLGGLGIELPAKLRGRLELNGLTRGHQGNYRQKLPVRQAF